MEEQRRRIFSSNTWSGRLLLSVGISIILWGFVTTTRDPERSRTFSNISVETSGIPDSLVVITDIAPISVTVKGPKSTVDDLLSTDLKPTLDLSSIDAPGTYSERVAIEKPEGIWSISTSPKSINLVVESLATKAFPISPDYSGNLGTQQQVNSFKPTTSEVTVTGAQSLVDRIDKVALPVDISNRTGTFAGVYTPIAQDVNGETIAGVTISPSTISATVVVSTRGKEIAVITQLSGSPAAGYEIGDRRIIPDTVLVDGPEDVLANLITVNTEIVDISGATADISKTVNLVGLPNDVTVLDPPSKQVQVIVQIRQRGVQQPLPSQKVTITNLEPGLAASAAPSSITLTVIGNEQDIEALSSDSLKVQVDVTGLGPGTYQIEPTVILPSNMEWTDIEPSTVTVTITETGEASPEASPGATPDATPP